MSAKNLLIFNPSLSTLLAIYYTFVHPPTPSVNVFCAATIEPKEQVIIIGDQFQIRCLSPPTNPRDIVDFNHRPVFSNDSNEIYSDLTSSFDPAFKDDCRAAYNRTKGVYTLICEKARKEFAGLYYCSVNDKLGDFSELIVLESKPICLSNVSASGNVGENSCHIPLDFIQRSCSVNFYGNRRPNIKWKNTIPVDISYSNTSIIGIAITLTEVVKVTRSLDRNFFECIVEHDTTTKSYNCDTANLAVIYAQNTTVKTKMRYDSNEPPIKCSTETISNNVSCQYIWEAINKDGQYEFQEGGRYLSLGKVEGQPNSFRCLADCQIKNRRCLVEAMKLDVDYSEIASTNLPLIIGIIVGVVILIVIVTIILVCRIKHFLRNRSHQLTNRMVYVQEMDQGIPLMRINNDQASNQGVSVNNIHPINGDAFHNQLTNNSQLKSNQNSAEQPTAANTETLNQLASGNHGDVAQPVISNRGDGSVATGSQGMLLNQAIKVSKNRSNLKKSMEQINTGQQVIVEEGSPERICYKEVQDIEVVCWTSNANRIFGISKSTPSGYKLIVYHAANPFNRLMPEEINMPNASDCRDMVAIGNHIYISDYSNKKCLWRCDVAPDADVKVLSCPMDGKPGFLSSQENQLFVLIRIDKNMNLAVFVSNGELLRCVQKIEFACIPEYLPVLAMPSHTKGHWMVFRVKIEKPGEWHISEISADGKVLIKDFDIKYPIPYFCRHASGHIQFIDSTNKRVMDLEKLEKSRILMKEDWAPIRVHWRVDDVLFVGGKVKFAMYKNFNFEK